MEIRAYDSPYRGVIEFFIGERKGEDFYVAAPTEFVFSKNKPGTAINPAFSLEHKEAQFLLQQLWDTGLRPNNGEGTSAQVDALKDHLKDMREIAFMSLQKAGK